MGDVTPTIPDDVVRWLAFGERGTSSETIVSYLTGLPVRDRYHPIDPADLRRCMLLLDACPSLAARFDEMRNASPEWSRLVDAWPKLTAKLREEMTAGDRAPETFTLMKAALYGAAHD